MEIVYHIGAHCTDDDALLKSLVKNRRPLAGEGIALPGPPKYRRVLSEAVTDMMQGKEMRHSRDSLLEEILPMPDAHRVAMSNRNFFCVPNRIFEGGSFYHLADAKLQALGEIFAEDDIEIMLAIRDPAAFIPAAFAQSSGTSFESFMSGVDPDLVSWTDLIDRILDAIPGVKLTVWCDEDSPFIWPHVLRAMAGVGPGVRIVGGYDLVGDILTPEGIEKLKVYFRKNPPKTEAHRIKVLGAFLERFARPEMMIEEYDNPGISEDMLADFSESYDEDVAEIAARDDIDFLRPETA